MRHIGQLDTRAQAEAFAAYLLVKGIESHVDSGDTAVDIWIREEDHFDTARKELEQFRQFPSDPRYTESISAARKIVKEQEKHQRELQRRIVNVRGGNFGPRPRLTISLMIASVIVSLGTNFGKCPPDHPIMRALQFVSVGQPESLALHDLDENSLQLRTASLQRGEIWRVMSPVLVHYGITHIAFNMYMFVVLGSVLEKRLGTWKYLGVVVATGAISNILQCTVPVEWGGSAPHLQGETLTMITRSGGMSGVIYGLFGFFWMKSIYDPKFGYRFPTSTVVIMLVWLVGCMMAEPLQNAGIGLFPTNIGNWAHGVGLAVGVALGIGSSQGIGRR